MIAIRNDAGLYLDLLPDQNPVTEQATAWLSDDELPGEFSYEMTAPLNERNKRFVGQGYRIDAAYSQAEMPVSVEMAGVLYRRCTLSYRIVKGDLSCYLKIDASEFYDKIRKLTLLEALADPISLGDGFISGKAVNFQDRLMQIANLKPGLFPCTFFPIRNEGMLDRALDDSKLKGFTRKSYVNAWEKLENGSFGFALDLPNKPQFGNLICPQFYLSFVLERIITRLAGYRIVSDWLADPEIQCVTIKNLTAMKSSLTDLGELLTGHTLVPGLFLPEMTVSDFLKAVKGRWSLVFTYNSNDKTCRITQYKRSVQAGPQIDLTPYQSGKYSTDYIDGTGYSVEEYIDGGDSLYHDNTGSTIAPVTRVIGKGQTDIPLKAGTVLLSYESSPMALGAYWYVPSVFQQGSTLDPLYAVAGEYAKNNKRPNTVGLCFISYRGIVGDSLNNAYPMGTPDVYTVQQQSLGTQALTLGGRNGAWRQGLFDYYYFRDRTQKVTQNLRLPVSILASLQLDRTVLLSLEDRIGRAYLINRIRAQSTGVDGLAMVELEALSLPSGIELGNTPDPPIVWLEFVASNWVIEGSNFHQPLLVYFWKDKNKTAPAVVTELVVQLLIKKSLLLTVDNSVLIYQEYTLYYTVSGSSAVLDPAFLFNYLADQSTQYYNLVPSVCPSDGYAILSQTYIDHV